MRTIRRRINIEDSNEIERDGVEEEGMDLDIQEGEGDEQQSRTKVGIDEGQSDRKAKLSATTRQETTRDRTKLTACSESSWLVC